MERGAAILIRSLFETRLAAGTGVSQYYLCKVIIKVRKEVRSPLLPHVMTVYLHFASVHQALLSLQLQGSVFPAASAC